MERRDICQDFNNDVTRALNGWIAYRVIPYSNAYSSALGNYNRTLELRDDELETRRELLIIVTTVVAVGALEVAAAAAIVAAASQAIQRQVLTRVACVIGRNSIASRVRALRNLRTFAFGPLRSFVSELASGPGKSKIEDYLDESMRSTSVVPSAQTPLQHRNALESSIRTAAQELYNFGQHLQRTPTIPDNEVEGAIQRAYLNSPFFQKCPREVQFSGNHPLATRANVGLPENLARTFERALWATWCLGLERRIIRPEVRARSFPYSSPSDPHQGGTEYTDAGSSVLRRMQQLGIRVGGQGVADYVGVVETDAETRRIVRWAETHLRDSHRQSR